MLQRRKDARVVVVIQLSSCWAKVESMKRKQNVHPLVDVDLRSFDVDVAHTQHTHSLQPLAAMSSNDVRDILNLGAHTSSSRSAGDSIDRSNKRHTAAVRKPDGISRELYALIGDNAPYLAETQASLAATKYREKPLLKSKRSKWCAECSLSKRRVHRF